MVVCLSCQAMAIVWFLSPSTSSTSSSHAHKSCLQSNPCIFIQTNFNLIERELHLRRIIMSTNFSLSSLSLDPLIPLTRLMHSPSTFQFVARIRCRILFKCKTWGIPGNLLSISIDAWASHDKIIHFLSQQLPTMLHDSGNAIPCAHLLTAITKKFTSQISQQIP